ncbi:MAG: hypothetical protein ACPGSC_10605 [Granulosicoccaceae bacterium]
MDAIAWVYDIAGIPSETKFGEDRNALSAVTVILVLAIKGPQ